MHTKWGKKRKNLKSIETYKKRHKMGKEGKSKHSNQRNCNMVSRKIGIILGHRRASPMIQNDDKGVG